MARPAHAQTRPKRTVFILLAVGFVLVGMGLPRFMAGVALGPQDQTLRDIADGKPVARSLVIDTVSSRETALGWLDTAGIHADLGLLYMVQAAEAADRRAAAGRADLLGAAVVHQRRALELAPRRAFVWARLAQSRNAIGQSAGMAAILERALSLAPYEGALLIPRIDVALAHWGSLPPALKSRFREQIRLAARWRPTGLAGIVRARFAQNRIVEMLADDPRLMRRFLHAYSRT